VSATTPRLVRDADLPGANAARSAVTALGIMAGPALGGVLLLIGPAALAFAVNAATFGLAALCVLAMRDRRVFAIPPAAPASFAAATGGSVLRSCGVLALAYGLLLIGRRPAPAPAATPATPGT
jgi:hypothetical protein